MSRRLATVGALVWAAGLACAGCQGRPAADPASSGVAAPGSESAFAPLYAQHCAGCHGAAGRDGPAPPLADPMFLAIVPAATLRRVIARGRPAHLMPAFAQAQGGPLSARQVDVLVQGLRRTWGGSPPPGPLPSYAAPAGGRGDAAAGRQPFARLCARCHGDAGQGKHAGALHDPVYLSLISDQALRRITITGRPDLGMPDYRRLGLKATPRGEMTEQERVDLLALLRSWRTPAGGTP